MLEHEFCRLNNIDDCGLPRLAAADLQKIRLKVERSVHRDVVRQAACVLYRYIINIVQYEQRMAISL